MRASFVIIALLLATASIPASAEEISRQDAVSLVRAAGYPLVSKTDSEPGAWDVWASKDGIAYEVKIDAKDGSMLAVTPLEDND